MGQTLYSRRCLGTVAYMVGLPSVPVPFLKSCIDMTQFNSEYVARDGEFVHPDYIDKNSYPPVARNDAVKRFMGDWLLQLDADHVFEPDLLSRMLALMQMYDLPILGTNYFKKDEPHLPVVVRWSPVLEKLVVDVNGDGTLKWKRGQRLYRADGGGGGGLLVKRGVFDKVREATGSEPFDPITPWSEDYSFFMRCSDLGIPYHISPAIEMKHLVWKAVGEEDHRREIQKWGVEYKDDVDNKDCNNPGTVGD